VTVAAKVNEVKEIKKAVNTTKNATIA